MTTSDNRPSRPRPAPSSTPDHVHVHGVARPTGQFYAGAVRWTRRGRWLDLALALASYATYLVTGGRFWLVSAAVCAVMWAVDLWLYRKLTRTAS